MVFINYETLIMIIYMVITFVSFYPITYQLLIIKRGIRKHDETPSTEGLNMENRSRVRVFIVVPAKSEPLDLIESSMSRLSSLGNEFNITYVLDNYDNETISIIKALGSKYGFKVIHREKPRGFKGGALNHVIKRLGLNDEDYMLVLDIDSVISTDTLRELQRFLGSASAVVPRWTTINRNDSLLARGQWLGYLFFFRVFKALDNLVNWVPILGSGSLVSVGAVRRVGYWPEDVLEDVELGVKFFTGNLRVKYSDNAQVQVEVPVNYMGFLRQQLRWSLGVGRVIRRYFWQVLRRRHGSTVMLYLGQYLAYILQLISILMLAIIDIIGLRIPLWVFASLLVLVVPSLALYLYNLIDLDREYGGDPRRDVFAINSVNLAFIMALPRIAIANLMGLLGIGSIEWVPTPKGSRKWSREGINLLPEFLMTSIVIIAFIFSVIHLTLLNMLITLPYLAGYVRGLWRVINGTL
ncbi:glycosyltransferase [Vulcanisaeta souniana]|uniref:Glycosyltransferase 2-like domain-containing protein n=1 Tax=Vulcanisaeta souniana JCM 11219 TaxID=1293586 RepID=A0ABM8BJZ7_9CREN|nr:glycosyltransferase family 2 protein [Vulcanisaeta souniana]BDR91281.1 hypothetical protein Vsou_03740 [Vulcanisaeta souniana JCM 11219]